jgi:hypothetical protein
MVVNEVNSAPVLPNQADRTVLEMSALTVTNTATDADLPANVIAYQLISPPAGASINQLGVITWTPTEAQGPHAYLLTTVATDNGVPILRTTNTIAVTVKEVNQAPVLPVQTNRTTDELATLTVTNAAVDADLPPNLVTYQLINAPTGASIDSEGVILWTPSEAQSQGDYTITTVATDNGIPLLSVTNTFEVNVFAV